VLEGYASRIIALSEEASQRVRAEEVTPTGQLALAASTMVAEYLLPAILRRYRSAFPGVRVSIVVMDSHAALSTLREERCELALVGAPIRKGKLESRPFAHDEVVLVGPCGGPKQLADASALADMPLVLREAGSGTRAAVADLLARAALDRPEILQVGSAEAARRCVIEGLGLSFISRHAVADDLKAKRLVVVALPGTPVRRTFHVARVKNASHSPAARALFDHVVGGP
jgi:DNA-binding transcriptional LysR family regulator